MNIFGIGLPEMAVIAAIGLLVFGPKRLPELGKTLGRTLRGFQSASQEFEKEFRSAITPEPASETEMVAAQVLPAADSGVSAAVATSDPQVLGATAETVDAISADQPQG
jgi:sec-independent protein translocase protein TatA